MKKRLLIISIIAIIAIIMLLVPYTSSFALTIPDTPDEEAADLVNSILGSGISATNVTRNGTIYSFSDGDDSLGVSSGIILDTSGTIDDGIIDEDLKNILGYNYGGHTSKLEFELTATGKLLNFNYAFASLEFDQPPQYNDAFGLFVSVNGGDYENIALIQRTDNSLVPVTITNLRAGIDGTELDSGASTSISDTENYSLFKVKNVDGLEGGTNGVSNVFNAQKAVNVGDKIKIKFVICDVTDDAFNSFVAIEAGSLSFDPPGSKPNFKDEVLTELNPGSEYWITVDGKTYKFTASPDGTIPLKGKDNEGNEYDFIGESLEIIRKAEGLTGDSEPQNLDIPPRPVPPIDPTAPTNTPKDIEETDITTTEDTITVDPVPGQEYSLDGINWILPDPTTNKVTFKDLTPDTEYTVYTRIAPTEDTFASAPTHGTKVRTLIMLKDLDYTVKNYEGIYDAQSHTGSVSSIDGTKITYSPTLNGTYTEDIITFKDVGTYDVYFCVSKQGYYSLYGKFTVTITKNTITVTPLENQGKVVNTEDGEIKYSFINAVKEETPSFDGKLSRVAGEEIGKYEILIGSLVLKSGEAFNMNNYELVFTEGINYEITPEPVIPEEPEEPEEPTIPEEPIVPEEPENPSPQTGDNILKYMGIMIITTGILFIIKKRKK